MENQHNIDTAFVNRMIRGLGTLEEKKAFRLLRKEDPVFNKLVHDLERSISAQNQRRFEQEQKELMQKVSFWEKDIALTNEFENTNLVSNEKGAEVKPSKKSINPKKEFISETETPIRPLNSIWTKLSIAASVILVVGLGWFVNQNFNTFGMEERLSVGAKYGEYLQFADDTSVSDTLCNCGQNLRDAYIESNENLAKKLEDFQPINAYQTQCKIYWQGWIKIQNKNYEDAYRSFSQLYTLLPEGEFRQRTTIGLMKSSLLTKRDEELLKISKKLKTEPVLYPRAHQFADEIIRKFE